MHHATHASSFKLSSQAPSCHVSCLVHLHLPSVSVLTTLLSTWCLLTATGRSSTRGYVLQVLEIKSLIGYFDLDPNKVAALFLDIWEDQWENEAYRHLLPLFSAQAIIASLAFIFISYQVCYSGLAGVPLLSRMLARVYGHGMAWHQQGLYTVFDV